MKGSIHVPFSSSNNNIGRQKELRGRRPVGYVSGVQRRGDEAQEGAVARIGPDIRSTLIPLIDQYRECVAIEWMNISHMIKSNVRKRRTYFSIINNPWLLMVNATVRPSSQGATNAWLMFILK